NKEVTDFLDNIMHPFRQEIQQLREIILSTGPDIKENIKWNGPNYTLNGQDRITIKVNPPKSFHLILHTGAKVQAQPANRLVEKDHGILNWKSNDRAIADFKKPGDFEKSSPYLSEIIKKWLDASI
ncbi:MAG: DUF1801 domain-containing protein, partial [Chitinophagaceae bacterium]